MRNLEAEWADALEKAWIERQLGRLISGGMSTERARIHAETMLQAARSKFFSENKEII